MRAAIIRLLKKHGPLTLRGLVARLKVAGLYRATHCARQLLPSGRVLTRRLIDPEKDPRRRAAAVAGARRCGSRTRS